MEVSCGMKNLTFVNVLRVCDVAIEGSNAALALRKHAVRCRCLFSEYKFEYAHSN